MANGQEKLYQELIEAGLVLSQERDLDVLLDKIVETALSIAQADACSLYVIQNNVLEFKIARNLTLEKKNVSYPKNSFQLKLDSNTLAGHVAVSGKTLNIQDVHRLHDQYDFKFDNSSDIKLGYETRSMLVVPVKNLSGTVVGVLQLINHNRNGEILPFPREVISPLTVIANQSGISITNTLLSNQLEEAHIETVYRLGMAAETRDKETGNHLKRMSHYSKILAKAIGMDETYQQTLLNAAPLHDVGKIGIPDHILQKNSKLTPEEWEIMKTHAELGYQILKDSKAPLLNMGAEIALSHHEKFDGTGYPKGLKGDRIPLEGRITAIADVFDALTSRRCYKKAWDFSDVQDYCTSEKGKHFDPELVDRFFEQMTEIVSIYNKYKD